MKEKHDSWTWLEPTCLCTQILQSRPQAFVGFAYGQTSMFIDFFFLADLANWTCLYLCISSSFAYMQFTCFECGMNFQTACILGSDAADWNYAGVWSESLGIGLCVFVACMLMMRQWYQAWERGEKGLTQPTLVTLLKRGFAAAETQFHTCLLGLLMSENISSFKIKVLYCKPC